MATLFNTLLLVPLLTLGAHFNASIQVQSRVSQDSLSVIPRPVSMQRQAGRFCLTESTVIQIPEHSSKSRDAAAYLQKKLQASTSYFIDMETTSAPADTNRIILQLAPDTTGYGNEEGYHLHVSSSKIQLTAPSPHGLFNGLQTLLQLFPAQILQTDYSLVPQNTRWTAPAVAIKDYPRFTYRGLHLDTGRHFFDVAFVKKYIDILAQYKMNRFHWHLTDDQGWRIQIKKYPKLTSVGAWRDSTLIGHYGSDRYDHQRYGGFYTQKQIREVVRYAQKRFVTVIPEIEMPGHASAALAAYPKLGCEENAQYHVKTTWGIFEDIYCPSDYTFHFLENVLLEVMDLFPSKYIHIGGDEAPKAAWKNSTLAQKVMKREGLKNEEQLQSYFIKRIEKFTTKHGRNIIGWDEILQGGLAPGATVESWRGEKGGIKAAQTHHNVIMAPRGTNYFDYYQANPDTEPLEIGGFTPLKKVYHYNPVPDTLTEKQQAYIAGTEATLWSEYIPSPRKAEYMAYPRVLALAEVAWSPQKQRDWNDFWKRLQPQFTRLDILDVKYAKHYKGQKPELKKKK